MPGAISKCRITVLKRMANQDLAEAYLDPASDFSQSFGPCDQFEEGQEFLLESPFGMPEGFCPWAWADIRHDILSVSTGASMPWLKQAGLAIAGCTDFLRPVIFRVERVD